MIGQRPECTLASGIICTYVSMCLNGACHGEPGSLVAEGDSPDPGDDSLPAMAIAAGADFLVTGDKPLLAVKRAGHARIVPPRRFAAMLAR